MRARSAPDPVSGHEQCSRQRLPGGVVGVDIGAGRIHVRDGVGGFQMTFASSSHCAGVPESASTDSMSPLARRSSRVLISARHQVDSWPGIHASFEGSVGTLPLCGGADSHVDGTAQICLDGGDRVVYLTHVGFADDEDVDVGG